MTRACSVCGYRRAVVYQPHTGRALCRECFIQDVKERVAREVRRWRMIEPGDRILLGLSGGKDSYVMLDILAGLHDPSKLVGVSIVEGIPGYNREEDIEKIRKHARELGVDVVVTSIKEYTGYSLYELVSRARERGSRQSPCTFCGISRRRILNMYARMLGADKTATAHNLDDEVQTAMVNMMRGDIVGLLRQHPLSPPVSTDIVPRIKPLRKIYEWETAVYAVQKGYPLQETECMFINRFPTLRAIVREELYAIEQREPGTLLRILENLDEVLEESAKRLHAEELPRCVKCGEPTSYGRRICKLCEILEEAGVERPVYSLRQPRLLTRIRVHDA